MSGAARLLDQLDRDSGLVDTLATDGSSSDLLTNAIWHAAYGHGHRGVAPAD